MKTLVYIGNKLSIHGFTPTSIETLGERLKEVHVVQQYSSKRSSTGRLFEMWLGIIRAPRCSIVLIDTYSANAFHFAWTCARIARFRGLSYIPFLHGGNLPQRMHSSPVLCRPFFEQATAIVSPSGYLKAEVEQRFATEVEVIPNYIDLELYPFREKTIDSIRLLWVRSFHQTYNPLMAVRVLRGLHDAGYTDAVLCMIGPDKDGSRAEVEVLSRKLQVDHALEITGRLTKAEWIEKSKEFNIFINTTNFDNTPVSVMEAMALGFPVVTTNVGGIPFLFKNGKEGIMTRKEDPKEMIDAIIKLFSTPKKLSALSQSARKKAHAWDWSNVRLLWESLFEEINLLENQHK